MSVEQENKTIDQLLRDTILTVVELREGADIASVTKLYKQCKQQVTTVREYLKKAQYNQDIIDDISYAQCALLDEVVLLCSKDSSTPRDYDEWLGAPLQVVFFNNHNAGYDLFEKIRTRLRADKKEALVLSCFDRVLGMGFQGCYLDQPQMEREHLIIALRESLLGNEIEESHPIIEQTKSYRYFGRKSMLILCTLASVALAVGLYFLLDHKLNALLAPLIQ
ncbi:type VI secretion system protein TssL, short form [Orbus sturtevantii]|uniref:type VI secretion system protein TssL, short form n=1 Tax=Orbus sturtevantii TaxID=3074109 RepID=UPI00370D024F